MTPLLPPPSTIIIVIIRVVVVVTHGKVIIKRYTLTTEAETQTSVNHKPKLNY